MQNFNLPALGGGAGLRHEHFDEILQKKPPFRWLEVISEDFMDYGGAVREVLSEICKRYRVIGHGVCMSMGSTDALDMQYLHKLKRFLDEIKSPWASDHLCFTMVDHTNLNDLIPLPFTSEAVENVVARLKIIQDVLERPFLVENVTRYVTVSNREMSEAEFLTSIVTKANCGILLDITNVYLNSKFHKFDPDEFIASIPLERVGQMHLAGFEPDAAGTIIDSHDAPVPKEVLDLFRRTLELTGASSVLIEWDKSLPTVERLLEETVTIDSILNEVCSFDRAA